MDLVQLIVVLFVLAVVWYLVSVAPFIGGPIKQVILWLIVLIAVLLILQAFGIIGAIGNIRLR